MKPNDLKPGDIIAISTPKKFLPVAIRVFMWLWSVIHYRKIPKGRLYNHTMIMLTNLHMAEAVSRGFVIRLFEDHYKSKLQHMVVFRLKKTLTKTELGNMGAKAEELSHKNVEYELLNFFWWAVYILTNGRKDLSPKGKKAEKKVFCFEVAAMLIEAARPGTFPNPSHVNTVDLQNDDRFDKLYFT